MTSGDDRPRLAALAVQLAQRGLRLRSGFNFRDDEDAPAAAVLLVGTAGATYWPHFQAWLGGRRQPIADPLDTWSRAIIGEAAEMAGARAVSPSDRPYWPFQQWAMRAEGLKPSPLGILMHPRFGLWHAYRGALLFDRRLPLSEPAEGLHLCDACAEKPCLRACPVEAHSRDGFAYGACLAYLKSESDRGGTQPHSAARHATCRDGGCHDRNACPFGAAYRYPAAVQAFHMAAFAKP